MKLSQLAGYKTETPIIALRHEAWLMREEPFSQEAIDFMQKQLTASPRDRRGSFSASSLGDCGRKQQFTYMGLEQQNESAQRKAVLLNGSMMHLKLQMCGISEGWLPAVEVPIPSNPWGLKGTMDGIAYEGSVVELKSQNSYGYRRIMQTQEPKEDHVFQIATYMLTTGKDLGIILYENKDNQETKEFQVHMTEALEKQVVDRLDWLDQATDKRELLPMLDECELKQGWRYNYCSYRAVCPLMTKLEIPA